ncbi:PRD domain-containing protein [Paenibacillus sp. DMB20]|uniref:PRD domain-containing protein n=1 Tax=Paenibacillus sp. DMB20 TaxID=1642570 RepID=UPI000627FBB4|nr:PRD domain-containing protein [Paenibacillus sp. DMB20]KKO51035.1 transcriptional antiterminator [Paenibacillus sp. DMB20]
MSALRERLDILFSTNTISPNAMKICQATIEKFIDEGNEKKYRKLVTHLAMAITRIERGEELNAPPEHIMKEIRQSPHFSQAYTNVTWIETQMGQKLPEEEREFLIMHFVNASHL